MATAVHPQFQQGVDADSLFVLIPDYTGKPKHMRAVAEAIHQSHPAADTLITGYSGGALSNSSPLKLAELITEEITRRVNARLLRGRAYDRITLVGYSIGAMLARQTCLLASGRTRYYEGVRPTPVAWAATIDRIILLAGVNRGWSGHIERPINTPWPLYMGLLFGLQLARITRTGKFLRSGLAGSEVIANLRLEWMDADRDPAVALPTVIQLIGDADPFADPKDHVDLLSGANFIYRKLPSGTDHFDAVRFDGPVGAERRSALLQCLFDPIASLESQVKFDDQLVQDPGVTDVVFVMHGIRDRGHDWQPALAKVIRLNGGPTTRTVIPDYGYMPMIPFLIWTERRKYVRWFMDRYIEARAVWPNANISYVGHSNGTFILADAIKRHSACRVRNVVFAGSVVRTDFPWSDYMARGQVERVLNFAASADLVVAVFPGLFERLNLELGCAGFHGFSCASVRDAQVCYVQGQHAAAIASQNFSAIASFIKTGVPDEPGVPCSTQQSPKVALAAKYPEIVWLAILAIIAGIGFVLVFSLHNFHWGYSLAAVGAYCLVLLLFLNRH